MLPRRKVPPRTQVLSRCHGLAGSLRQQTCQQRRRSAALLRVSLAAFLGIVCDQRNGCASVGLRCAGLLCALAAALVSSAAVADPGVPAAASVCQQGISPDTTQRLFTVLNHPPAETDCKFEGLGANVSRLEARWSRRGTLLPPLSAVPWECAPHAARRVGHFAVDVPPEIEQSCPSVAPRIAAFLDQLAEEKPGGAVGSLHDPLFRGAQVLFVSLLVITIGLLGRGVRRAGALDPGWVVIGIASFSGALALRAALPFSLGNWYTEVLPAAGPPPWMRFGPGAFAFQSLLRAAGLWGPRALVLSQLLLGAVALPLLLGVLWELRVGLGAAAATLVLLIVDPFHARLSATPSEHVLASTLCLGLLLCWLRAARTGDWMWFGLSVLLFAAVCATRVDMSVQATLVLLWPLLRDRAEREGGLDRGLLWWRAAVLGTVAALVLLAAYRFIALPSHHPLGEARGHLLALHYSIRQYWVLATTDPGWISLPAVLLALVGAARMALRRPLLLVRITATLLVSFVALGRMFLPDELLGARYFLFTIPVFLVASGQGFAALLGLAPRRHRRSVAAVGIVVLGLWSGAAGRRAYAVRYAFQDEYTFLRRALAQLPAGCTVYQLPMRLDVFPRDLDCCLDIRRTPLVLEFPGLRFLDLPDDLTVVFEDGGCNAYYESIACEITDDPHNPVVHERAERTAEYLHQRCAAVREIGTLRPLAQTTTSPRATVDFFHGKPPHARLYRWTR
jgi:hypothetical protein